MRAGALAMIDALGFRGIWSKEGSKGDVVLHMLEKLRQQTDDHLDKGYGGDRAIREGLHENRTNLSHTVRAIFLSDTIVFAVQHKTRDEVVHNLGVVWPEHQDQISLAANHLARFLEPGSVRTAASYASATVRSAALSQPALAYRGAISFGEFSIDKEGRFLVGRAVDDAASHHESAQGAFVWLTPKGLRAFTSVEREPTPFLLPYEVPMKGGLSFETHVVSPFAHCTSSDDCGVLEEALLRTFDADTLDVANKRLLTQRFLKRAREYWQEESDRIEASAKRPQQ